MTATRAAETAADGVTLRPMTAVDLPAAHALSTQVGWPHRLVDLQFSFSFGEGLVAQRDGAAVGIAMRWRWGGAHASVGSVVVAPHCQGRRIGQRLMLGLLDGLEGHSVLLHATREGRGLYERLGFVAAGDVRQHQGLALQAPLVALEPNVRLRPASRNDGERLIALDQAACGMPRGAMLRALLDLAQVVVLDRDGVAEGFSVLRRFGRGKVIGPVVAPDATGAKALISHWVNLDAGKFVRIDVDFASGLPAWLETLGLRRVGEVASMQRGPALHRGSAAHLFALVTQATG